MVNVYSHRHRRADSARMGQELVAKHQAEIAALAEAYPPIVRLPHFVRRDLAAAIAAHACTATWSHPVWGDKVPPLTVIDVQQQTSNYFVIKTADGREWVSRSGFTAVTVYWHDLAAIWNRLTLPMRRALCTLANPDSPLRTRGGAGGGVHHLTLRALTTRGLLVDNTLTPFAAAIYRQHKSEFEHDVQ